MKKPGHMITDLFNDRIWTLDTSQSPKSYARLVRFVKLVRITAGSFANNNMGFQCIALSYFVLMSLIPFVGLLSAVTGGLGLGDENISEFLYRVFPANPEFVDLLAEKAVNIINQAKGGGTGLVSAIMFLWTIVWLMFQVERVFNNAWNIRKIPRKIYKRFGFYLMVLILLPFLVVIFGAGITYYTNLPNLFGLDLSDLRFLTKLLGYVGFYFITVLTLAAMYTFIPATKVSFRLAFKAALVSGFAFMVFQYLYLNTQVILGRLSSVYGVIAAIPLFLIWLNFSWQIILYGAELTYGFHNEKIYKTQKWES